MNILLNCDLLRDESIEEIETLPNGSSVMWTYIKLLLHFKESRTDHFSQARRESIMTRLLIDPPIGLQHLAILAKYPHLVNRVGGSYYLPEITKELLTLKGRLEGGVKGSLKASLNKGMGKGKDLLKEESAERNPKSTVINLIPDPVKEAAGMMGRKRLTEYVWVNELSYDILIANNGVEFMERAVEKLNGWIGVSEGTPEFEKRKRQGKNFEAAFQSWLAPAVAEEKARAEKVTKVTKSKRDDVMDAILNRKKDDET